MSAGFCFKLQSHGHPHALLGVMHQIQQDVGVETLALAYARPRFGRQVRLAFEIKW